MAVRMRVEAAAPLAKTIDGDIPPPRLPCYGARCPDFPSSHHFAERVFVSTQTFVY
jgi:hypothetical protein